MQAQSTDLKLVSAILKVVKKDEDGKITKIALVAAMEDLAALVNYDVSDKDLASLGYLWSVVDVDQSG